MSTNLNSAFEPTINEEFMNKVFELRLESDIDDIIASSASLTQYKVLSLELTNATRQVGNNIYMKHISSIIKNWKDGIVSELWKEELKSFCIEHEDIIASYSAEDEGKRLFIIVMDDSTSDKVLDYNEFGFELKKKYPNEIDDFMVLDSITVNGIDGLLNKVSNIYTKG
jgi:hypothetical protein